MTPDRPGGGRGTPGAFRPCPLQPLFNGDGAVVADVLAKERVSVVKGKRQRIAARAHPCVRHEAAKRGQSLLDRRAPSDAIEDGGALAVAGHGLDECGRDLPRVEVGHGAAERHLEPREMDDRADSMQRDHPVDRVRIGDVALLPDHPIEVLLRRQEPRPPAARVEVQGAHGPLATARRCPTPRSNRRWQSSWASVKRRTRASALK